MTKTTANLPQTHTLYFFIYRCDTKASFFCPSIDTNLCDDEHNFPPAFAYERDSRGAKDNKLLDSFAKKKRTRIEWIMIITLFWHLEVKLWCYYFFSTFNFGTYLLIYLLILFFKYDARWLVQKATKRFFNFWCDLPLLTVFIIFIFFCHHVVCFIHLVFRQTQELNSCPRTMVQTVSPKCSPLDQGASPSYFQYRIKKTYCLDYIKFITEDTMVKMSLYIWT